MKNLIFKFFLWFALAVGISSCDGYLGGDTNIDPNRTNDASLNTLTPTILFFSSESNQIASTVANQYIQQIGSVAAGGTETQQRTTFAGVFNNIYLSILPNANAMIKKAEANNSPHYAGLAKVVIAYNLGLSTSIWENIPYSKADNQLSDFSPKYDTQEQIYKDILRLLDEAITDLSKTESLFKPGTDDIIFKGNIANWLKTAYTLKARFLLHMSKKNGATSYTSILDALSKGIKANTEDFQLIYTDRNLNRWYQVALANNTGNNTTNFSETFVDLMNGTIQGIQDPRIPLLAYKTSATDTVYRGMVPGRASGANTRYNNGTIFFGWNFAQLAPIQMITNAEAKFIEAEVRTLQNNGKATTEAYNAYIDGIKANMSKIGVPSADINKFLGHPNIAVGADKLTLANILTEKYKALFLNPEAWNDLRRYDYSSNIIPGLQLPELHNPDLNGKWIQRGHYPDSEASRNTQVATENFKELVDKMWIFN